MGVLLKRFVALYDDDFDTQLCATSKWKDFLWFPFNSQYCPIFLQLKCNVFMSSCPTPNVWNFPTFLYILLHSTTDVGLLYYAVCDFCVFYVLLTVHPGMILVNNQLDAQFFMYVYFYFFTCFGQPCAHHQDSYCINATPGLCHPV